MPAAMHMAGHHTQWNRMISLPIRWWTAGHHSSNRCCVLAVADGGEVVDQRVVPDVEDVLLVPGDPHPPVDRGPGDGDVPQPTPDEAERLVALRLGYHRARVGLVPVDERLFEGAQPEEVVLLLEVLDRQTGGSGTVRRRGDRPRRSTARRARSTGRGRGPCRYGRSRRSGPGTCWTAWWCRGSVVRMKSSLEMSRSAHAAAKRGANWSVQAAGVSPCSSAARATFCPCSSVPVRKKTSSPIRRCQRASASALTVV